MKSVGNCREDYSVWFCSRHLEEGQFCTHKLGDLVQMRIGTGYIRLPLATAERDLKACLARNHLYGKDYRHHSNQRRQCLSKWCAILAP